MTRALFILALLQSALVLFLRWGHPLASPHAFRECQTALTVYWMVHHGQGVLGDLGASGGGGNLLDRLHDWTGTWLAYQTPVMGPPWQIPYEFPTFQLVVAGVVYATSISLDNAGRLVDWLFMVGCCLPLSRLGRRCGMDDPWYGCVLFLASPLYLYWGTAFLIETCSLFLCLMFLWMVEEERWGLTVLFGILAAMTKLPTFIPFAILSGLLVTFGKTQSARRTAMQVWVVILASLCGVFWTHWTDTLKAQNPLSAVLMSSQPAQRLHDFGTLVQRLSWWPEETLWRSIKDLF